MKISNLFTKVLALPFKYLYRLYRVNRSESYFKQVRNQKNNNRIILVSKQKLPSDQALLNKISVLKDKLTPFNIDISSIYSSITSSNEVKDWPDDTRLLTDQYSPANLL